MDGISMQSVFQDPKNSIRDFVYAEQGPARSIKTKDWSYTAIRYTADQVELTKGEQAERGFKLLSGLSGGVSRAALQHPGAFDSDQLYDLSADPNEQVNLANKPEHATRVQTMQKMLVERLKGFDGRPYGEFLPGGNAVTRSQTQAVLDILKTKSGTEKKKNNRKNRKNGNPKRK
jgi:arylsulfatase A-like enzyme